MLCIEKKRKIQLHPIETKKVLEKCINYITHPEFHIVVLIEDILVYQLHLNNQLTFFHLIGTGDFSSHRDCCELVRRQFKRRNSNIHIVRYNFLLMICRKFQFFINTFNYEVATISTESISLFP